MSAGEQVSDRAGAVRVPARLVLFGYPAVEVDAVVLPRPKRWRVGGAIQIMAVFAVVAPVVALLPPHAPWPIGALAVGGILSRRRYTERFTLLSMTGSCPNCGGEVAARSVRMRTPHPLTCEGCHHQLSLKADLEGIAEAD